MAASFFAHGEMAFPCHGHFWFDLSCDYLMFHALYQCTVLLDWDNALNAWESHVTSFVTVRFFGTQHAHTSVIQSVVNIDVHITQRNV